MGSKTRGSAIKKDRLMLILKSRKITITKLAESIGYNRRAINHAISHEYMDNQTLNDICKYLDVLPDFITGAYPLRKIKDEYKNGIEIDGHYFVFSSDPSGYDVPPYVNFMTPNQNLFATFRGRLADWLLPYTDMLTRVGKTGLSENFNDENKMYFDSDFVRVNSGYLVPPIRAAAVKVVQSAINQDPDFVSWAESQDIEEPTTGEMPQFFEVIEEGQPPEEVEDGRKETD